MDASMFHYLLQFLSRPIPYHKASICRFIDTASRGMDKRVLDFGCGEGIFAKAFLKIPNIHYVGVDKNVKYISFARRHNPQINFFINDHHLCFKSATFDFIVLNCVLHHMSGEELVTLKNEMKRIVKENGSLLIIELTHPHSQKNPFFRTVTFFEKLIHKISYLEDRYLEALLSGDFRKISKEEISDNFIEYVYQQRNAKDRKDDLSSIG